MAGLTRKKTAQQQRQAEGAGPAPARQPTQVGAQADALALQRTAGNRAVDGLLGGAQDQVPPIVKEVVRGGGQPLDAATQGYMEERFGEDFSGVKVHTDAKAAESAEAVDAHAYTMGRDVVFGAGEYRPETGTGKRLLAHELAHVVQQASGRTNSLHGLEGDVNTRELLEREASNTGKSYLNHESTGVKAQSVRGAEATRAYTLTTTNSSIGKSRLMSTNLNSIGSTDTLQRASKSPASHLGDSSAQQENPHALPSIGPHSVNKTQAFEELRIWQRMIDDYIDGNRAWLSANWIKYLSYTSGNPRLSWSIITTEDVISNFIGNALTEFVLKSTIEKGSDLAGALMSKGIKEGSLAIAGAVIGRDIIPKVIKKGSLAIAGAVIGTEIAPLIGTAVGFVGGVLIESVASAIFEIVSGKNEVGEARVQTQQRLGRQILTQTSYFNEEAKGAKTRARMIFDQIQERLHSASTQPQVNEIADWAIEQKKAIPQVRPENDSSLFERMLQDWVLEHAGDEEDPNKETDEMEWKAALAEAFKAENLDLHPEIFAYQCRSHWAQIGVPGDAIVERMIHTVAEKRREVDAQGYIETLRNLDPEVAEFRRREAAKERIKEAAWQIKSIFDAWGGGTPEYVFTKGFDHARLINLIERERGPLPEWAKEAIRRDRVTVKCRVNLWSADGAVYVDHWSYDFIVQGSEEDVRKEPLSPGTGERFIRLFIYPD